MELATIPGVMPERRVSPNAHTIRPSLSKVLAPMSAASHAGRFCAASRSFAASAEATPTGLPGAGGHEGSSRADGAVVTAGEVELEGGAPSGSPVQPAPATSASAISHHRPATPAA